MNAPVAGDRTRSPRVWLALVAVLCLGTGVLLGLALRGGGARTPTYLEQLTQQLDLRPEQVAAIEATLAAEDHDIDELLGRQLLALQDPVAQRRAQTEAALLAALDETQRQRYAQLTK